MEHQKGWNRTQWEPAGSVLEPARFALVGSGWRAEFFLRLAAAMPDRFEVAGVASRDIHRRRTIEATWSTPTSSSVEELVDARRPDFVVAAVARSAAPDVIRAATSLGLPILSETPPASDVVGLTDLWTSLANPGMVQIAEQYPYLPRFQAYSTLLGSGLLGAVTSAQVSWTHGYHGIALLRALLPLGEVPVQITASSFVAPIVQSLSREGWPEGRDLVSVTQTIATLDFGSSMGLYDFTDGQWFHPFMRRRVQVRGTEGEISGDDVVRLVDPRTPIRSSLVRRQTGVDGDLEGYELDIISLGDHVLYRNPFQGFRLSDEEIAIATLLAKMHAWTKGEADPPYSLADASQDHCLALAVQESSRTGRRVEVGSHVWTPQAR